MSSVAGYSERYPIVGVRMADNVYHAGCYIHCMLSSFLYSLLSVLYGFYNLAPVD